MTHTLFIRDTGEIREATRAEVLDQAASLLAEQSGGARRPSRTLRSPASTFATRSQPSPMRSSASALTREYLRHQVAALPYEVFGICAHPRVPSPPSRRAPLRGVRPPSPRHPPSPQPYQLSPPARPRVGRRRQVTDKVPLIDDDPGALGMYAQRFRISRSRGTRA
jgi:hypothetical protein